MNDDAIEACQKLLGYVFKDVALLKSALTHSSIAEHRLASNERMEFLGDAVLGMVVCEELFLRYPESLEGELTKIKSDVVSRKTCGEICQGLGLDHYLIMGKGVRRGGKIPRSLAACAYESLIGAIYLDGGLEAARKFVLDSLAEEIGQVSSENHKSALQEYVQRELGSTPSYRMLDEKGPDHSKCFEITAVIRGRQYPSAWGPTKKEAEQKAAMAALKALGQLAEDAVAPDEEPAEDDA